MMIPRELYNVNQIFFGSEANLSPIVVKNPGGSCSVLPNPSVVILLFHSFLWSLWDQGAAHMCPSQPLWSRSDERNGIPSIFTWPAAILNILDVCVCGEGRGDGLWWRPQWRYPKTTLCFSLLNGVEPQRRSDFLRIRKRNPHLPTPYCPLP